MDVLNAIDKMLTDTGTTRVALSDALGRSKQSISNMFSNKTDVRVDTLANMAEFMGYELVLRSKKGDIVITPREKAGK